MRTRDSFNRLSENISINGVIKLEKKFMRKNVLWTAFCSLCTVSNGEEEKRESEKTRSAYAELRFFMFFSYNWWFVVATNIFYQHNKLNFHHNLPATTTGWVWEIWRRKDTEKDDSKQMGKHANNSSTCCPPQLSSHSTACGEHK